jgi:hypothetical protein
VIGSGAAAHRMPRIAFASGTDRPPTLKEFGPGAEMVGMVNIAFGIGIAVAIVLAFWLLVSFIDDLQQTRRTIR